MTPEPPVSRAQAIAEDIAGARDGRPAVGQVDSINVGKPEMLVFVFPERHDSRTGQIEIAIMLHRLYQDYGLRHAGLEGFFVDEGALDGAWFQPVEPFKPFDRPGERENVILNLLERGEIGGMETLALLYSDFNVIGVENREEYYNDDVSEEKLGSIFAHLYAIAGPQLTEEELRQANHLSTQAVGLFGELREEKLREHATYVIRTDAFTRDAYDRLTSPALELTCQDIVEVVALIIEAETNLETDVQPEGREELLGLQADGQVCARRASTISENLIALAESRAGEPVALSVGASHTQDLERALRDSGISFAVIRPKSLVEDRGLGLLTAEDYQRKLSGYSVDADDGLGALLDGRKRPRPADFSEQEGWSRSYFGLVLFSALAARTVKAQGNPTYEEVINRMENQERLLEASNIQVNPGSFEALENGALFSVTLARAGTGEPTVLWLYARSDPAEAAGLDSISSALFESLSRAQQPRRARSSGPSGDLASASYLGDVVVTASRREQAVRRVAARQ